MDRGLWNVNRQAFSGKAMPGTLSVMLHRLCMMHSGLALLYYSFVMSVARSIYTLCGTFCICIDANAWVASNALILAPLSKLLLFGREDRLIPRALSSVLKKQGESIEQCF